MPNFLNIPVIVMTSATLRDVPSAEQLGVYAVVSKPHDMGVLRTLIEQCIGANGTGGRQQAS